jgi:hydrogenase maturation protein HypF
MRVKIQVTGIVQGVGFRPFIYRTAIEKDLKGYVKNRGDAGVEILLEGSKSAIHEFLSDLKLKKPPLAQIFETTSSEPGGKEEYTEFTIVKSSSETGLSGSVIPPDIAICNDCLTELRNPKDPRFDYFFITCTNCGPRFTTIEKLPYDRENTAMHEFSMCSFCLKEYKAPLNRRFHAQTIACPDCGPKAYLTNSKGKTVKTTDPVRESGKLLSKGHILAIKGYGGFHIAASTTMNEPLRRLREAKHRNQKPFAIMARDLEATKTFANINKKEQDLLTSYSRPIVLLNKSSNYYLSDLIVPELHNVGVMLPYTALHYMLFDQVDDPAFVMTSANPANQPIVNDNNEALTTFGNIVDYFLFHNRKITQKCDDSVARVHKNSAVFIRRSRGYAPAPIRLKQKTKHATVGLGAELNNTSCIINGDKAFISQHIGDVENVETRAFLIKATKHLIGLTQSKVDTIACDLHPKFTTTKLAKDLAEENDWQLVQIQHHYAHAAALMTEHDTEEIISICCDGYGYGPNGEAWGGEILLCTKKQNGFKRLAHLQPQPLPGGDLATHYPLRMAAGILHKENHIEDWLNQNSDHFPHGKQEVHIILQQLKKSLGAAETTSCGRVLDAVSAVLGICYERTYEGEPSMKLESLATKGHDLLRLQPIIKNNTLDTTQMLSTIFEKRQKLSKQDLAYSAHAYIAKGLAALATEKASQNDVKTVGFTGGVAYNEILTLIIRKLVEIQGLRFLTHETVPPGDGGLSFGQAVASAFSQT